MDKLELFVLKANIARFARLLGVETEEQTRSRISALLNEARQKLKVVTAERRSSLGPFNKSTGGKPSAAASPASARTSNPHDSLK